MRSERSNTAPNKKSAARILEVVTLQHALYPTPGDIDRVLHPKLRVLGFRVVTRPGAVEDVVEQWTLEMSKRNLSSLRIFQIAAVDKFDESLIESGTKVSTINFQAPPNIAKLVLYSHMSESLTNLVFYYVTFNNNTCMALGKVLRVFTSLEEVRFNLCKFQGHQGKFLLQTTKLEKLFWGVQECAHLEDMLIPLKDTGGLGFKNGYIHFVPSLFASRKEEAVLKYMLAVGEKHKGFDVTRTDANVVLGGQFLEKLSYAFFRGNFGI